MQAFMPIIHIVLKEVMMRLCDEKSNQKEFIIEKCSKATCLLDYFTLFHAVHLRKEIYGKKYFKSMTYTFENYPFRLWLSWLCCLPLLRFNDI